jgi:hypothetical protein
MTIGPAPMITTFLISVRLGMHDRDLQRTLRAGRHKKQPSPLEGEGAACEARKGAAGCGGGYLFARKLFV